MFLNYKKITIRLLFLITVLFGVFYANLSVEAQTNCCVKKGFEKVSGEGYLQTADKSANVLGCRIVPNEGCAEPVSFCIKDGEKISGVCASSGFTGTVYGKNYVEVEVKSLCTAYTKCGEVLTASMDCGKHNTLANCAVGTACVWSKIGKGGCFNVYDANVCNSLDSGACGTSKACKWVKGDKGGVCMSNFDAFAEGIYKDGELGGLITKNCALLGTCKNVNDLVIIVVEAAKEIFSYVGVLAFAFFVYGGVTMILAFGNPERFNKGKQVLIAAVIGMLISFSAYALVNFTLNALGVSETFRVIK